MDQPLIREQVLRHRSSDRFGPAAGWQPVSLTLMVALFVMLLLCLVMFAWWSTIKSTASVSGVLVPASGMIPVVSAVQGIHEQVLLAEGDTVSKGQVIATVSTERHAAHGLPGSRLIQAHLQGTIDGLAVERSALIEDARLRAGQLETTLARLGKELAALEQERGYARQRLALDRAHTRTLSQLLDSGVVSEAEYQRQYGTELTGSQQLARLAHGIVERESRVLETKERRRYLVLELERDLHQLDQRQRQLEHELALSRQQTGYSIVSAGDGLITGITAVPGEAVRVGEVLGHVMTQDVELLAMLLLPSEAVGQIAPGQQVMLNYDAFPFQTHGNHRGTVRNVSRSAVDPTRQLLPLSGAQQSSYLVHVSLESQSVTDHQGARYQLLPGMTLQADIVIAELSILAYILDPLLRLINR